MESGRGRDQVPPGPEAPQGAGPPSPASSPDTAAYGGPVPPGGWTQPAPHQPLAVPVGQLAGWWRRVGATVLDALIIAVPALAIMAVLGIGIAGAGASDSDVGLVAAIGGALLTLLVIALITLVYAPLTMMRKGEHNGKTLGKQALGIRVVRTSGEPMDFLWAALREVVIKNFLVGIVSSFTFGIATLVNYLWPLWDDENRALHDFVVSTRVVMAA